MAGFPPVATSSDSLLSRVTGARAAPGPGQGWPVATPPGTGASTLTPVVAYFALSGPNEPVPADGLLTIPESPSFSRWLRLKGQLPEGRPSSHGATQRKLDVTPERAAVKRTSGRSESCAQGRPFGPGHLTPSTTAWLSSPETAPGPHPDPGAFG